MIPFDPSPNFDVGREGQQITHIVIHAEIGTQGGTIAWFEGKASQVSSHYLVARDGSIVQMVKDEDKAWHVCNANAFCLGIEHEDLFKDYKGDLIGGGNDINKTVRWWTLLQLVNSAKLVAQKMKVYNVPLANVIGHDDPYLIQYGNNHRDPGVLFPWAEYRNLIRES